MAAKVDTGLCTGCGACVEACPVEAVSLRGDKANIDAEKCVDCGACESVCPMEAISLPG